MAFARRALLQQSDVPDWVRTPVPKTDSTFACPGYDPDLSRFTITGEAEVIYSFRSLDQISSSSEVYPSRAQAVGDFKLGATPAFAGCLHRALVQGLHTSAPGLKIVHASARAVRAPKIGERAVAYRLSATVSEQDVQLRVYMDVLAFQRGRTQAVFVFTGVGAPLPSQLSYARVVDARLR